MEAHGDCEFLFAIGRHCCDLQALLHHTRQISCGSIHIPIGSLENIVLLISYIHPDDLRQ